MALDDTKEETGEATSDGNNNSEVPPTYDELVAEVDILNAALVNQDKLLLQVARDRKENKEKLAQALKDLDFARASVVVEEEKECDACLLLMVELAELRSKHAGVVDELAEVKARPMLLGACKSCSGLRTELAEKDAKLALLEKASSVSTSDGKCALCEALELELVGCRHDKMRSEEENTYLEV